MLAEGQVRDSAGRASGYASLLFTPNGDLIATPGHADYTEPGRLARLHSACTAVAGVAPGTALSTTPPFTLYNPANSGKIASVLCAILGYVSGTLGSGTIVFAVNATPGQAVPTGGTELTPQCQLIGGARGACRVFQGSTLAATPVILRPAFVLGAYAGGADLPGPRECYVKGSINLSAGTSVSLQGVAAAGTTPLVLLAMEWEEMVT